MNIGDKVKRISGAWSRMKIGDIGTISTFDDDKYNIKFKEWTGWHNKANFIIIEEAVYEIY